MQHRYGGPETLELEEAGRPKAGSEQVLVRVRAAALNPTDYVVMRGRLRVQTGWRRPNHQIRGFDVAGQSKLLARTWSIWLLATPCSERVGEPSRNTPPAFRRDWCRSPSD